MNNSNLLFNPFVGLRSFEENEDYLFFGRVKLRYIFDGADLAILVGFIIWGVYSVIRAYIGKRKP